VLVAGGATVARWPNDLIGYRRIPRERSVVDEPDPHSMNDPWFMDLSVVIGSVDLRDYLSP
jgi:hypothetical protein